MPKVLLVAGSAPCVFDDLQKARLITANYKSELMTINGACTVIEDADHMLAGHTNMADQWVRERKRAFPGLPIRVHAGYVETKRITLAMHMNSQPDVTDWWDNVSSGATSAGKAAMIGLRMGFDKIILCGCPMNGGGYVAGEAVVAHDPGCARVGHDAKQKTKIITRYREKMAELAKGEFRGKVFSMSGFTREVLGAP